MWLGLLLRCCHREGGIMVDKAPMPDDVREKLITIIQDLDEHTLGDETLSPLNRPHIVDHHYISQEIKHTIVKVRKTVDYLLNKRG